MQSERDREAIRLLRAYLAAEYRADIDGVELVIRVGERLPEALTGAPNLAFITAWNPRSRPCDEATNRAALDQLRGAIAGSGPVFDAVGGDPRLTWSEPSLLALDLPVADADRLARRFEQNAIVVARDGGPARLRVYRPEWRAAAEAASLDTRFVEWVGSPAPA